MWAVQRVFGDEWRTIAVFEHRASADVLARAWHRAGAHAGYRAVEVEAEPADLFLDGPALPAEVLREVHGCVKELTDYLMGQILRG